MSIAETSSDTGHIAIPAGRVVDLTHVIRPGEEQYTFEVSQRVDRQGPEGDIMKTMYLWSHAGTHIEAPLHFLAAGEDTAQLPLRRLFGPATIVDFRHKGVNEPMELAEFEAAGIEVGDIVVTWTGREDQYGTAASHDRPYVTEEACRWLVDDRRINAIGTDSSGFEVRGVSHHPNHRLVLGAGIPVIECLCNLGELRSTRVFLAALPWPVVGLDACPVRAIAIAPEEV